MKNKLLIFSIICSIVFISIFTFYATFKNDSYDIPNRTFLNMKEYQETGAARKYVEWDFTREISEKEWNRMYGLMPFLSMFQLIILAENVSIRSSKIYAKYKNKKLLLASIANILIIFILYLAVLYYSDYFKVYMNILPMLFVSTDTIIISSYTLIKYNMDNKKQAISI